MKREKIGSRLGFLLLSAGCAIGLGNVWRFPYIVGKDGGGWFVAIYLICLAVVAVPVLAMEFATGRAAKQSVINLHATLTPERPAWRLHGLAGFAGTVCILMFYTTVSGWMLIYSWRTAAGCFAGLGPDKVAEAFAGLLADPLPMAAAMVAVTVLCAGTCAIGLSRGVERVTKWMMLCLFALIIVLAANAILIDMRVNNFAGLRFYLVPDLARLKAAGVTNVIADAMSQAFFTISLGIGAMSIFGSYIDRSHALLGEAVHVTVLDTIVAIAAGLVVIPACFAHGVDATQGPGLAFVTLPNVFNAMPFGRFWGALFFIFTSFAALTTAITLFEGLIGCMMDSRGWSRAKASAATGAAIAVLSVPCILGFNLWSGFRPFGAGSNILDLEDFVVSNVFMPLGALAFVIYCTHRCGWGWDRFREEADAGRGARLPRGRWFRFYCSCILPVAVLVVFVFGLLEKFG